MLLDAIVKLHDKIQNMKLGANREAEISELEQARLRRLPLAQGTHGLQVIPGTSRPMIAQETGGQSAAEFLGDIQREPARPQERWPRQRQPESGAPEDGGSQQGDSRDH
jgi:hypothetical protein